MSNPLDIKIWQTENNKTEFETKQSLPPYVREEIQKYLNRIETPLYFNLMKILKDEIGIYIEEEIRNKRLRYCEKRKGYVQEVHTESPIIFKNHKVIRIISPLNN